MVDEPVLLLNGQPPTIICERAAGEWSCAVPVGATARLRIGDTELEPFLRPGESIWRWRWVAPASAGSYPVCLTITTATEQIEWRYVVDVTPSLLDAERYAALLTDLARLLPGAAHALAGGWQPAGMGDHGVPDRMALLALLTGPTARQIIDTVAQLARRPSPRRLRLTGPRELGAWPRDPDPARWRIAADAVPLPGSGWPDRVWMQMPLPDPNQRSLHLAALVTDRLLMAANWLIATPLPSDVRLRLIGVMARLRALRVQLPQPARPAVALSGGMPALAGERRLRAYYPLLRRQAGVGWTPDLFAIPVREVARLYELWCVIQVAMALLALADWHAQTQALIDHDAALRIEPDQPVLTLTRATGDTLTLRYQPRYAPAGQPFASLDSRVRIPDIGLEVIMPGQPPRLIALDAKYRADGGELPASAIDEGYSYLAGIGRSDGQRAVIGLALLFPGAGPVTTYASGLTLLPLWPDADQQQLRLWLEDRLRGEEAAYAR